MPPQRKITNFIYIVPLRLILSIRVEVLSAEVCAREPRIQGLWADLSAERIIAVATLTLSDSALPKRGIVTFVSI